METTRALTALTILAATLLTPPTTLAQIATLEPTQNIAPPPDSTPVPEGQAFMGRRTDVDGNTLLISPSFGRAAYVYTRPSAGRPWTYAAELVAPDGFVWFNDVALSGDIAVMSVNPTDAGGNVTAGVVHVFARSAAGWTYRQTLAEPAASPERPEFFGFRVDLDNNTLAVSNFTDKLSTGVVYVYSRNLAGDFELEQDVHAATPQQSTSFGFDVAINERTLLVGAAGVAAYVFTRTASGWVQTAVLEPPSTSDGGGFAEDVAIDGNIAVISSPWADQVEEPTFFKSGTAFIFRRHGGDWTLESQLSDPVANSGVFGQAVEVQDRRVVVSAWGRPLATNELTERLMVFEREHGIWRAIASASRSGEFGFGYVLSSSGDDLIATVPASPTENPVFEGEVLHFVLPK